MINKLGHYIFKRIQKDNIDNRNIRYKPRESMTGLYIGPSDIQRYVNDYFNYGIDHMGDDESAEDRIERYWDDPEGREE
tara:strand:+ start:287 stop:523 length:237 start_codon:yes stop_codon:yes gene_type:complete